MKPVVMRTTENWPHQRGHQNYASCNRVCYGSFRRHKPTSKQHKMTTCYFRYDIQAELSTCPATYYYPDRTRLQNREGSSYEKIRKYERTNKVRMHKGTGANTQTKCKRSEHTNKVRTQNSCKHEGRPITSGAEHSAGLAAALPSAHEAPCVLPILRQSGIRHRGQQSPAET